MRIVIDLQSCQSGSRLGGIGRYSLELAKAMARNSKSHDFWLMLSSLLPQPISQIRHAFSDLIPQDQIVVFDAPAAVAELANNKAKVRAAELIREDFLKYLNPDIVHVSSLFEGLQEDVVTSVGNLFPAQRTAVTLYDLIPLVQREQYLANIDALNHYLGKVEHLKKAGLSLAISEFSRQEAIELLNLRPEQVVNISSAADERFRPLEVPTDFAKKLLVKYGISRKFIMYTGSFDQRKNHANLIKAFGMLPGKIRKDHQLVIVGNGWDGIYAQLRGIAQHVGLHDDDVIFAGHVSDKDLLPLYNLCHLFVFPSLSEGFGLPVLEAMSCGVPTIGSNCTSIPEVIGWSEALFDPRSAESISKKINHALTNEDFRNLLRRRGMEQSKKFSWDESARKAIEAFEEREAAMCSETRIALSARAKQMPPQYGEAELVNTLAKIDGIDALPDGALVEMAQSIGLNQYSADAAKHLSDLKSDIRLGWITSWNTRCGIASYSDFLIEHFPKEVRIFAADASETVRIDEGNVARCWEIGAPDPLDRLKNEIEKYDINTLIIQFNYSFFDFKFLSNFIREQVAAGKRVFITFHSTRDPSETKRLALLREDLALCEGILVHSTKDVDVFAKMGLTGNVHFLPQGIIEKKPTPIEAIPSKDRRIIATYGFALPSKGLREVLDAFSILVRDGNTDLHLLMVNAEYPDPVSSILLAEIKERILERGLSNHVTLVTDYLSDEESLGYLQHADLIVFGYQETGESSSAAVRMGIASRRPVAVTPNEIFNDVRSSVFVLPGSTPDEIASGVRSFLELDITTNSNAASTMKAARRWTRAHTYKSISRHLSWLVSKPKSIHVDYYLPPSFTLKENSNELRFKAALPPMKTSIGESDGTMIQTVGREGHVLFGPFISAAPGHYRALIRGEIGNGGVGAANFDIAISGGSQVIARGEIMHSSDGDALGEIAFTVPEGGCTDLEVRVWAGADSDLKISMLALKPSHLTDANAFEYLSIED